MPHKVQPCCWQFGAHCWSLPEAEETARIAMAQSLGKDHPIGRCCNFVRANSEHLWFGGLSMFILGEESRERPKLQRWRQPLEPHTPSKATTSSRTVKVLS
eukprot:4419670-Amphidinium_carterae.1